MKAHRFNTHILIRCICLFLCVMGCLAIGFYYSRTQGKLTKVSVKSENNAIIISWDAPDWFQCDYVTIQIEDDSGVVYEKNVWPIVKKITYKDGEHGKAYTVSVSAHYRDASYGEAVVKRTLFLDYDQLPDIPLMIINTYSGEDPTYDVAEKPNGLWGATMVSNEYLSGEMVMSGGGMEHVSMGVDIRVRGNTSSIESDKKSYKIKLDIAFDLLGRNDGYLCSEWILLNNGNSLKTYIGDYVGTLCGMEWQPQMMFVNVILNGDWKGCYCLTEAVCLESSYGLVSETGYIFENDAYWWNSEDLYFKTNNQIYQMGYTFKYPQINSNNETAVLVLQNYMQEFEDKILALDASYQDYIDEESFAKWILARDILGNDDAGGSNIYYYIKDFDKNDPILNRVKMGPLWDFDRVFCTVDTWSSCRSEVTSYFPQLFSMDSFVTRYTEAWEEIFPDLYDSIKILLDDLEQYYGEDIEASWQLEGSRWDVEYDSFYEQKEQVLNWFIYRTMWMNNSLGT